MQTPQVKWVIPSVEAAKLMKNHSLENQRIVRVVLLSSQTRR